ncbi:unnamed protein product [Owenia fusiformis]|uniref:Inositol 2-dehydrogenase n=1 Tax=Owenia fusiformis TaxID=6347 RepID=A0A8J1TT21_OWEFU|nr:unnamed protein product [Owenia fusiformis]
MAQTNDVKITIAIFGMGRMGKIHFQNALINAQIVVKYIVEAIPEVAEKVTKMYQLEDKIQVVSLDDADIVYKDKCVDAVMVITPAFTHHDIIEKALKAGKAVFSEKPLAPTLAAVEALYELADSANKPLFCAFNRRWDPQLRSIHNSIKGGDIGNIRMVKSCSRDPPGLSSMEYHRTSGGIFLDMVIHDIDMVCWLAGETPTTLTCTAHAHDDSFKEIGDYDTVAIMMNFPSGCTGLIDTSRCCNYGYDQRVEIHGPGGMLQSENLRETALHTWTGEGMRVGQIPFLAPIRYKEAYKLELDHFVNVVLGKETSEVTSKCTINAIKIALACDESAKTNQPVTLQY